MAIFNSYVKLPEGNDPNQELQRNQDFESLSSLFSSSGGAIFSVPTINHDVHTKVCDFPRFRLKYQVHICHYVDIPLSIYLPI